MTDAFYSLGLNREQLIELQRALLARYIIDETFRREHGEESKETPALLGHLERLLEMGEEEAHSHFHEEEDRLWEYSWYAYTDEWAWHRARQETQPEMGDPLTRINPEEFEDLIEKNYDDHFDRYTSEIDMAATVHSPSPKNKPPRRAKK